MDVIEYSREEAARLQNSYIGPEHLMLGIIRDGEGKAVQALRELNVDEWDIKRKIEQEIKIQSMPKMLSSMISLLVKQPSAYCV